MAFALCWDARTIPRLSNLLSAWRCETFYQFPGFNFRKNEEKCRDLAPVSELLVVSLVEKAARLTPL